MNRKHKGPVAVIVLEALWLAMNHKRKHNCPICGENWFDGEECTQPFSVACAPCAFGSDPDWVAIAESKWEE